LQDDLREQRHEPIRPALRGGLKFNEVVIVAARDDKVDVLVDDGTLLVDAPAVVGEEVGDEVFELAFDPRARGARVGEQRGHDFTLAMIIIVAVLGRKSSPNLSSTVKAEGAVVYFSFRGLPCSARIDSNALSDRNLSLEGHTEICRDKAFAPGCDRVVIVGIASLTAIFGGPTSI
jgi:hypothetical protein